MRDGRTDLVGEKGLHVHEDADGNGCQEALVAAARTGSARQAQVCDGPERLP